MQLWQRASEQKGKINFELLLEQRQGLVSIKVQNTYATYSRGKEDIAKRFKLLLINAKIQNLFVAEQEIPLEMISDDAATSSYGLSRSTLDESVSRNNGKLGANYSSTLNQNAMARRRRQRAAANLEQAAKKAKAADENYVAGWKIGTPNYNITVHDNGKVEIKPKNGSARLTSSQAYSIFYRD